jgi:hypothetical protein
LERRRAAKLKAAAGAVDALARLRPDAKMTSGPEPEPEPELQLTGVCPLLAVHMVCNAVTILALIMCGNRRAGGQAEAAALAHTFAPKAGAGPSIGNGTSR